MAPPKPAPDQQTKKLQVYLTPVLLRAILLLLLSDTIVPQSIIKTLPGFPGDLPFELETGHFFKQLSVTKKGIQEMTLLYFGWRVALVVLLFFPSSMKSVEVVGNSLSEVKVGLNRLTDLSSKIKSFNFMWIFIFGEHVENWLAVGLGGGNVLICLWCGVARWQSMAPPKPAPDQQTKKLQVYLTPVLLRAILLLLLSDTIVPQSIIKTLPGFPGDLPFELETGYIGVGERDEVQLFYYFLESERNPRDDPLILWMAGGPGCSSLFSFFYEIGPLKFNFTLNPSNSGESKPTLELNPYSWTKVANIIFIDQPAGSGFSYAKKWEAYNSSDTRSASLTYDFLRKWLVDHPNFLNNPLYICGISYIGIVVPIVVQEIYNGNEAGKEPRMKIKVKDYIKHLDWAGYILFNPLTNRNSDINSRIPYAHRVALLSDELYEVANIIFIDQPAGSGFSYAKKWEAYNSSDTRSASLTYDFLRKWLVDHPNFLNNPLYICGISYIGIVVPIVVQEIYNGNEAGKEPRMKIKVKDYIKHLDWAVLIFFPCLFTIFFYCGYILFNPLTNRNSDINSRIPYAHRVALLSDELYESAKSNCQGVYIAVDPDNRLCASDLEVVNECVEKIYFDQILEPICLTTISKPNLLRSYRSSLEENPIDIIWSLPRLSEPWCRDNTYKAAAVWANDKAVQNALHIREVRGTIREWVRCNKSIQYSFGLSETVSYTFNVPSSVDYHRNLTNKKCRALIASGDHDMVVPHLGTEKWIRSLNLTVESDWEPWFVEGQVAGWIYRILYTQRLLADICNSKGMKS
ncbi:unnamed protein product, partial [Ilex paraguariensis]